MVEFIFGVFTGIWIMLLVNFYVDTKIREHRKKAWGTHVDGIKSWPFGRKKYQGEKHD